MAWIYDDKDLYSGQQGIPLFPTTEAIAQLREAGGDDYFLANEKELARKRRESLGLEPKFVGPPIPVPPEYQGADLSREAQVLAHNRMVEDQRAGAGELPPRRTNLEILPDQSYLGSGGARPGYDYSGGAVVPSAGPDAELLRAVTRDKMIKQGYIPLPDVPTQAPGGVNNSIEDWQRAVLTANITHPGASFEGGNAATGSLGTPVYRGAGNQSWVPGASMATLAHLDEQQRLKAAAAADLALKGAQTQAIPIESQARMLGAQTALMQAKMNEQLQGEQLMQLHAHDFIGDKKNPITGEIEPLSPIDALERVTAHPLYAPYLKPDSDVVTSALALKDLGAFGPPPTFDANGNVIPSKDRRGDTVQKAFLAAHLPGLTALAREPGIYGRTIGADQYAKFLDLIRQYYPEVAKSIGAAPVGIQEKTTRFFAEPYPANRPLPPPQWLPPIPGITTPSKKKKKSE
jgi:hypothetical protein